MQKQVKAAVIEGPGKISIQHFPYPDLEQYQGSVLKVRNAASAAQTSIPIAAKQGKTAAAIQNLT